MAVAIIKCGSCDSKFDVSGFATGSTIKCGKCKSLLEVPTFSTPSPSSVVTLDARTTKHEIRLDAPLPDLPQKKREASRKTTQRRKRDEVTTMRRKPEGKTERRNRDETTKRRTRRIMPADEHQPARGHIWQIALGVAVILMIAAGVGISMFGGDSPHLEGSSDKHSEVNLLDTFDSRWAKGQGEVTALWSLAGWCEEQKLESRRHKVLLRIVELDPKHAASQKALGRIEYRGQWIAQTKYDAIRQRAKPIEEVLGKRVLKGTSSHFDLFMERSGDTKDELAVENEAQILALFQGALNDYMKGFFSRKKDDLYEYSRSMGGAKRFRKLGDLPRKSIAIFTVRPSYEGYAKKVRPQAVNEHGFYSREMDTIFIFYDGANKYPAPFYDSFLFELYFQNKDRNPNVSILWKKGMASLDYLGKSVDVSLSKHFLVAVEVGQSYSAKIIANQYTEMLEELYQTFWRSFKPLMSTRQSMSMMPIYIFKERAGYLKYGKKENKLNLLKFAGGHYEPLKQIMMTFRRKGKSRANTVLHEGTHLLMHYLSDFKKKTAMDLFWFQEGIADYFAGFTHDSKSGKLILGYPNQQRLEHFKPRVYQARPLEEFVKFDQRHWGGVLQQRNPGRKHAMMMQVYTQGWAFCHFLMHGAGGKYRQRFLKFVDSSMRGGQTLRDFNRCMGQLDYKQLHKEFVQYILGLRV